MQYTNLYVIYYSTRSSGCSISFTSTSLANKSLPSHDILPGSIAWAHPADQLRLSGCPIKLRPPQVNLGQRRACNRKRSNMFLWVNPKQRLIFCHAFKSTNPFGLTFTVTCDLCIDVTSRQTSSGRQSKCPIVWG